MVVGRYRLLRPLGQGGMGAVWQAQDTLLGRDVAIKEIYLPAAGAGPADPADPGIRRALREAQAAARLHHPSIVTVHDVVTDQGRPWIVMELVNGRSLAQAIVEHGLLTEQRAAEIGLHVLDALTAAHAEGVAHRDVKPANILLDNHRVVLTDFGIAAIDDATALTATGQMIGSPAYLAPERINGRPATAAADLWALGVTLYTTVTGRSPFQRDDTQATLAAILTSRPTPPAHAGRLWPVIKGLLDKDPARRLTAEQARKLLVTVANPNGVPGAALPVPGQRQPGWWPARARRRRSALDDTAGTLAAPPPTIAATTAYQTPQADLATRDLAGTVAQTGQASVLPGQPALGTGPPRPAPPPLPGATRPPGRRRWVWPVAGLAVLVLLIAAGAFVLRDWKAGPPQSLTPTAAHTPAYAYTTTLLAGRPICAAAWNPAGTRYAVTSSDTGLEIFDQDGVLVRKFTVTLAAGGHCYLNAPGVYWDPSGTTVAVIGGTEIGWNRLYFFNAETGTTVMARLAAGKVSGIPMWEPTGSAVAVMASSLGVVLVSKDGAKGRELLSPSALSSPTHSADCMSISPQGDTFAVGLFNTRDRDSGPLIEMHRFADGATLRSFGRKADSGDPDILAYSPTGALLAVGLDDFGVEVWDPVAQRRVATLHGPEGVITDLRWSADGRYLLAVSHGQQRVHVFRASDWALLGTLTPHEESRRRIGVAAGGVGNDGSVLLVPQGSRGIDVYKLT